LSKRVIAQIRSPARVRVGDLALDCDMWSNPDGSGQRLMVLTAEPGSPSHDALRILTSWTAGQASANLAKSRNP
jgi:MmyB-like transcription regulator ligand binding domain